MKIIKRLVLLVLACFLFFFSSSLASSEPVTAINDENSTQEDSDGSQTINIINTDLYVGEQNIVIEDAINGNVFAFGANVTVKGEIFGDLFVLTVTLTIEETAVIHSNIFALADTMIVKGEVYDIYALANSFELDSSSYIYRDLKLYSQEVTLNGLIAKDAYIFANNITMPENARSLIGGNLHYTSTQEFTFPEEAVLGEIQYTPYEENSPSAGEIILSYVTNFINAIVYALVIILIIILGAPKFAEKISYALIQKSYISAGIGILAIVLIPFVAILAFATGFLTYISIVLLVIYGVVLASTLAIFGIAIGKYLVDKLKNPSKGKFILLSILSASVLWLTRLIPYIGGYITLFIFVVGLGVFIFTLFIRKDVSKLGKKDKTSKK